jgi:NADH:ubiquinone oxidoreductase subunit K
MISAFLSLFFPAIIVTLFSIGCLAALLKKNGLHALIGLLLMGWSCVVLLAALSDRNGNSEGFAFCLVLIACLGIQTLAGMALVVWMQATTGSADLEK